MIKNYGATIFYFLVPALCLWMLFPLAYIPSDEVAFVQVTDAMAACLKTQWFCLPPPVGYFTKPFYQWVLGVLAVTGISALTAMYVVNYLSLSLLGVLFHSLTRRLRPDLPLAQALAPLLFLTSFTLHGIAVWPSYSLLLGLLLALTAVVYYQLETFSWKMLPAALLTVMAFYTHVASVPYLLSFALATCLVRRSSVKPIAVTLVLAVALIAAVEGLALQAYEQTYFAAYRVSYKLNVEARAAESPWFFYSQVIFYYIIAEGALLALLLFTARKIARTREREYLAFIFALVLAFQSLGPQQKIIRNFWFLSLLLMLWLMIQLPPLNAKRWRVIGTMVLLWVYVSVSALGAADLYRTVFALRHTVDAQAETTATVWQNLSDPVWEHLRRNNPWEVLYPRSLDIMPPETFSTVLAKLAPEPRVKLRSVELPADREREIQTKMEVGDFLIGGSQLETLQTIKTFPVGACKVPIPLAFENEVQARRVIEQLFEPCEDKFLYLMKRTN